MPIEYRNQIPPDNQGQGIGTNFLHRLVEECRTAHIRGTQLFCARGKRAFYEKNGFVARPDDAPGMQLKFDQACSSLSGGLD